MFNSFTKEFVAISRTREAETHHQPDYILSLLFLNMLTIILLQSLQNLEIENLLKFYQIAISEITEHILGLFVLVWKAFFLADSKYGNDNLNFKLDKLSALSVVISLEWIKVVFSTTFSAYNFHILMFNNNKNFFFPNLCSSMAQQFCREPLISILL